jgi:hypothetical protein
MCLMLTDKNVSLDYIYYNRTDILIKLKHTISLTLEVPQSQARDLPDKDRVLVPGHIDDSPGHHPGQVLLEADHQSLNPLTGLWDIVDSSDLTEAHEEVLDNDMLLPADWEIIRLNQDLVRDGIGRQFREALEDVDGAAIDKHDLVDILLGNRVLAESDNTRALATDKVDAVHLAKRRE